MRQRSCPPWRTQGAVTQLPERFYVAEIIQEKVFKLYREEVPYCTTVRPASCAACSYWHQAGVEMPVLGGLPAC